MSDRPEPQPEPSTEDSEGARRRARRRAEVFGEVLPESTRDDRDDRGPETPGADASEEWLRRNVPPHHG